MSNLLKCAIVLMIFLVSIVGFSVCAEGSGDGCTHAFCGGADRSRPLARLAQRIGIARASATAFAMMLSALAFARIRSACTLFVPGSDVLGSGTLRI